MKKYIKPIFIIYCAVMLWLLFGQRIGRTDFSDYFQQLRQNINLIPFETVRLFIRLAKYSIDSHSVSLALRNLLGNIVLFMPLGLLREIFPRLKKFIPFILTVTAIISAVEILQFFTLLGSCDIDDLILNLAGASLGYFLIGVAGRIAIKKENESFKNY